MILFLSLSTFSYGQTKTLDSFVREWLGTPYRFGGNSKTGIDCSQFTKRLYKDVFFSKNLYKNDNFYIKRNNIITKTK